MTKTKTQPSKPKGRPAEDAIRGGGAWISIDGMTRHWMVANNEHSSLAISACRNVIRTLKSLTLTGDVPVPKCGICIIMKSKGVYYRRIPNEKYITRARMKHNSNNHKKNGV